MTPRASRWLGAVALAAAALAAAQAPDFGDPRKELRVAFPAAETGFDPQASSDLYSNYVNRVVFDPLYRYDYLARPFRIVPNTAVALPEISADGLTWTIRVRPGIHFADDPVFKGERRELTAHDYVYAWKRVLDPRMRSPVLQTFDNRFAGAEALVAKARETGRLDYDAPLEGLQAVDRYTIRIRLLRPQYDLVAELTTSPSAAVAREVVEAYGDASGWAMANPVGTGPFRLKEWRRGQRIVLEANPGFRDLRYPESTDPGDAAIVARLKGKRIPRIGRVDIAIIEESNPRLLAFERAELDYTAIPPDLIWNVMERDSRLKPRLAQAGAILARGVQPSTTYWYFNMEDPVVGGYSTDRVALRRAISMAYNVDEEIRVLRQDQAQRATQVLPPPVTGHDPRFDGHVRYDPAAARALLDKFGYVDRDGDGWRDLPDAKPMLLRMASGTSAVERQYNELWQRNLNAVGLRVEFEPQKFGDLLKRARAGQVQMWGLANTSTHTDGSTFLGLLYGGHAGLSNLSRFRQPEYDRLYDRARGLPDGPERTRMFREMGALVSVYAPWKLAAYRIENVVVQPWVLGYKYNPFQQHPWLYLDIDPARPRKPIAP